ncbi:glycosyltransferase family protein [Roseomonas populi]|uniref:Glycosyltransferase RgtA/B/C/D-like domain-containing protein n=1 Tax=Roseomonas populi TaxID=3121582 RepID=A0ABT1XBZ3_9PROT|nr:hypothetical protein [Roseomonas pecuniae]MCR0985648.1 hypothetical protein [Roseomonas pecuniae]
MSESSLPAPAMTRLLSVFRTARGEAWLRAAGVVLFLALTLLIFYRVPISNRFSGLWGDRFDGGIEASILEHWYNVLRGRSWFSQTNYFYPNPGTLGYNDGFFLYGLIHSIFRAFRVDIFLSSALVDMVVKSIGFVFFYLFVRRAFAARALPALLGATVFSLCHALFIHAFHQQLLSVSFAPVMGYLLLRAREALSAGWGRGYAAFGCGAAALYSAWLLTAFYMSWFFGFFALCCALAMLLIEGQGPYRRLLAEAWRFRWHSLLIVAVFVVTLLPFLSVYLPKASETGMHGWRDALAFSPRLSDAINLGPGNLLFGGMYEQLCRSCTKGNYELLMGMPPILVYLFVCAAAWALWKYRGEHAGLLRAVAAAAVVTWLMLFRFKFGSGWELVFNYVPGAKGLRVVSRYQIFLAFPVAVVVTLFLQRAMTRVPSIFVLLGVLLVVEQVGTSPGVNSRAEELARIAAPRPPAECRAFYVTKARGQDSGSDLMKRYPHNVEAMLIAELRSIPTINGYSTFNPPGWDFEDPLRPDYLDRVRAYAQARGIQGLCQLDLETLQWSPAGF